MIRPFSAFYLLLSALLLSLGGFTPQPANAQMPIPGMPQPGGGDSRENEEAEDNNKAESETLNEDRPTVTARPTDGEIERVDAAEPAVDAEDEAREEEAAKTANVDASGPRKVYVVPIEGAIVKPQLFIVRRALKDAIENDVRTIVLRMDTPGGRGDIMVEMMEAIDKFEGTSMTFVDEAISAGAFITIATDEIYMQPDGLIGAAAAIQSTGEDLPETMKAKYYSYLNARVRTLTNENPMRAKVLRAMSEVDYEFEIDGQLLLRPDGVPFKEPGELLTLTGREAVMEVGDPPQRLLAAGLGSSVEDVLDARFGPGNYEIEEFEITWSENVAKYMTGIAPGLLTLGILLLVLEFKTPGFGFFGITGAGLLVVVFLSNYVAGVAGYESILLVFIGAALIIIELLLVPGILVLMGIGFVAMLLGLVWMLADIWPTGGGGIVLNPETFVIPIIQVFSGLIIAMLGAIGLASLLPRSFLRGAVILDNRVGTSEYGIASGEGGGGTAAPDDPTTRSELPGPGTAGTAATDLFPTGSVEIDGKRYEARANLGTIDAGTPIRVVKTGDYALIVEEDRS